MPDALVVLTLTLLLGIQPVTTDLYLPSLPGLARDFGAMTGTAQLTLSALILAFGLGQLVSGPVSDRVGRRPVLLVGVGLYALAAMASTLASDIQALVAARVLQGLGMAASVTCGRSIVRDLYAPPDGARAMSRAMTGLGVIAFASPILGGLIGATLGWRAAMTALAGYGLVLLAVVALRLPETLPERDPRALHPTRWWANVREVLAHPGFRAWTLLASGTYGGLFGMLAASSFVFIDELGMSHAAYGATIASFSTAYIGGTVWCRGLLQRRGLRGAVRVAAGLSLGGGLSMAALALAGVEQAWALIVPQWAFMVGHGIHQPCSQVGAVGPFPRKAGVAAALSGFAMMLTAFVVGLVLGQLAGLGTRPLACVVGVAGLIVAYAGWVLVQRHGEPLPAAARAAA